MAFFFVLVGKYLRSVGVLASVGHRDDTGAGVVELEVLILEIMAPNRLSSSSIATSEVALRVKYRVTYAG